MTMETVKSQLIKKNNLSKVQFSHTSTLPENCCFLLFFIYTPIHICGKGSTFYTTVLCLTIIQDTLYFKKRSEVLAKTKTIHTAITRTSFTHQFKADSNHYNQMEILLSTPPHILKYRVSILSLHWKAWYVGIYKPLQFMYCLVELLRAFLHKESWFLSIIPHNC